MSDTDVVDGRKEVMSRLLTDVGQQPCASAAG